jgi:hypothetical protein
MLAEPHATFTIAESIDIISECLEQGNCNANQIRGQEALFVIGNTGAGKSTTVNYLCGCKMQFKMRKELGLVGGGKVCVVIPKEEGGPKDEIMQIGHSNQSQTFLPQIEHDEETGTVYCDCAGFLETRGAEINIGNAVNTRKAIALCASVRLIVLINYMSLKADRGKGLKDLVRICLHLFGTAAELKRHAKSIVLGVTQYPPKQNEDSGEGGSFDEVKALLTQEPCSEVLRLLSEQLVLFDPANRPFDDGKGLSRDELLAKTKGLACISNPDKIFHAVLTDSDEARLVAIANAMEDEIIKALQRDELGPARDSLRHLRMLEAIEHVTVTNKVHRVLASIDGHYRGTIDEFKHECFAERLDSAALVLQKIRVAAQYFPDALGLSAKAIAALEPILEGARRKKEEQERKEREHKGQLERLREEVQQQARKNAEAAEDMTNLRRLYEQQRDELQQLRDAQTQEAEEAQAKVRQMKAEMEASIEKQKQQNEKMEEALAEVARQREAILVERMAQMGQQEDKEAAAVKIKELRDDLRKQQEKAQQENQEALRKQQEQMTKKQAELEKQVARKSEEAEKTGQQAKAMAQKVQEMEMAAEQQRKERERQQKQQAESEAAKEKEKAKESKAKGGGAATGQKGKHNTLDNCSPYTHPQQAQLPHPTPFFPPLPPLPPLPHRLLPFFPLSA